LASIAAEVFSFHRKAIRFRSASISAHTFSYVLSVGLENTRKKKSLQPAAQTQCPAVYPTT